MKKLMITAAAVMLGISANASLITWQLSSALQNELFKGATAYLINTTSTSSTAPAWSDALNATYLASYDTYTIDNVLAMLDDKGVKTGGTATVADDLLFKKENTSWTSPAGSNKKFYVIVIDDEGKNMTLATSYKKTNIVAGDTPTTLTWSGAGEFSTTYKAEAVPEPTSAMLLLLGMAGLALRRRRA